MNVVKSYFFDIILCFTIKAPKKLGILKWVKDATSSPVYSFKLNFEILVDVRKLKDSGCCNKKRRHKKGILPVFGF